MPRIVVDRDLDDSGDDRDDEVHDDDGYAMETCVFRRVTRMLFHAEPDAPFTNVILCSPSLLVQLRTRFSGLPREVMGPQRSNLSWAFMKA